MRDPSLGGDRTAFSLCQLLGAAMLAACGVSGSLDATNSTSTVACQKLDARLTQLVRASDIQRAATANGLDVDRSGVLVTIELAKGVPLPTGHGLIVMATYADLVDARVPIPELCALTSDPAVVLIRPPRTGVPDGSRP